ncbi:hypothetical protein LINPERHAP1_LOCUS27321 [Linum perenne]
MSAMLTERSIREASRQSTSRTLLVTSLPLVCLMCSPLARVPSHGFRSPRARVSS